MFAGPTGDPCGQTKPDGPRHTCCKSPPLTRPGITGRNLWGDEIMAQSDPRIITLAAKTCTYYIHVAYNTTLVKQTALTAHLKAVTAV